MRLLRQVWTLIREVARHWQSDDVPRLAAALAYYTLFSLTPLLVIVMAIAGPFLGRESARAQILGAAQRYMGPRGALAVQEALANISQPGAGTLAGLVGLLVLFYGASNVFAHLKGALNAIMGVAPRPELGIRAFVRDRLIALAMVLAVGLLLLVSLLTGTILSLVSEFLIVTVPGGLQVWQTVDLTLSWLIVMVLFAVLYRVVPDVNLAWRDTFVGAAIGAVLFILVRAGLTLYLTRFGARSVYGAAGSFVALLLWGYFSAQVLFLGAEVTLVFAERFGAGITPTDAAIPVVEVHRDEAQTTNDAAPSSARERS